MKLIFAGVSTALTLAGSASFAQSIADQVVAQLQAEGYQRIEVKNGLSQVKVEAIRDGLELEVVYDAATGAILMQEVNPADASDRNLTGVEIKSERRDYVETSGSSASGSAGDARGSDDDESDDDERDDDERDDDERDDDERDDDERDDDERDDERDDDRDDDENDDDDEDDDNDDDDKDEDDDEDDK